MIGMYCNELARFSETYGSLWALERPDATHFMHSFHASLARAQNEIAQKFLASESEYLFLTNDDHVYPPDTLTRLLAHKKEIVSGIYLRRGLPFEPVIFSEQNTAGRVHPHYFKQGDNGLIPVKACGGGCLLIHRSVLEKIPQPWWNLGTIESDLISEDISFCKSVNAAGFQIWCDLSVRVGHIITAVVWPYEDGGNWSTLLRQGKMGISLDPATAIATMQIANMKG